MTRSITITFERMPGFPTTEVVMIFKRVDRAVSVKVITSDVREGSATCHPKDEFSLEFGMRLAVKRARNDSDGYWRPRSKSGMFYRAFRRWMWLRKQALFISRISPIWSVAYFERSHSKEHAEDIFRPNKVIAREFGHVTVEVK